MKLEDVDLLKEIYLRAIAKLDEIISKHRGKPGGLIPASISATPAALGPKRSQSIRTSAAFFISTRSAGTIQEEGRQGTHQRFVAESRMARSFLRLRISSHASYGRPRVRARACARFRLVRRGPRRRRRRFRRRGVGAGEDQAGIEVGGARALQNAAQFVAAFGGQRPLGIRLSGFGILGDAVAKQVDLHTCLSL